MNSFAAKTTGLNMNDPCSEYLNKKLELDKPTAVDILPKKSQNMRPFTAVLLHVQEHTLFHDFML